MMNHEAKTLAIAVAAAVACASLNAAPAFAAGGRSAAGQNANSGIVTSVLYVSDRGASKIVMFPANTQHAHPIGQITQGIVEPEGIAVDSQGDLYVANGNGGNVLEFTPGGRRLIRTLSAGLHHPVNVAFDTAGNLFIADQSPSAIVEYHVRPAGTNPTVIALPNSQYMARGITVDAAGNIFASMTGISDKVFPLIAFCPAFSEVYEIPAGTTTPVSLYLRANEQTFGLAVDARGTLYASDPCLNTVAMYTRTAGNGFAFAGFLQAPNVSPEPFYITMRDGYVSIPSPVGVQHGYVTIVSPTLNALPYTISDGLQAPISAAVGSVLPPPPLVR
jgi:streptogramin lyase